MLTTNNKKPNKVLKLSVLSALIAYSLGPAQAIVAPLDSDLDGVFDGEDNCLFTPNAKQWDLDKDGLGNACDVDDDGDGFSDEIEKAAGSNPRNANSTPNSTELDTDNDGIVDSEDNCPTKKNKGQWDYDKDGLGNACDKDDDNDGYTDFNEKKAGSDPRDKDSTPNQDIVDTDSDGVSDELDNCPKMPNRNQFDYDKDGQGNKCDLDDDNDTFTDKQELAAGSDPKNELSIPLILDRDHDGVPDELDQCPDEGLIADAGLDEHGCVVFDACTFTGPCIDEPYHLLLEAEDFTQGFDKTKGNEGGAYREQDDVDIGKSADGYFVGWNEQGEWLSFADVVIPHSGNYQIKAKVATEYNGSLSFDLNASDIKLGSVSVTNTGGWEAWQVLTLDTYIEAGIYSFGTYISAGIFNIDSIEIVSGGEGIVIPEVTWADEFDEIDLNTWSHEVGGWGGGNNELQWYSDGSNAHIEFDELAGSNVLVMQARQEQGGDCWYGSKCDYTSSRMITRYKKSFMYGRIEASIKLPRAQGIWPAFWLLGDNFNNQGWPDGGEIDIMEHVGTNNTTSGALHGPGYSGATPITGHLNHQESISDRYNTYAIEWDITGIRWFVNDIQFYSTTTAEVMAYGNWVYDQPFWILLNVAVGGNWPGDPDHANYQTQEMRVDYIRVYQ